MRPFDRFAKPAELQRRERLRFLGEQDGPPERELKAIFAAAFRRTPAVRSAYLARVAYGEDAGGGVALCVRSDAPEDESLVGRVGAVFAERIDPGARLDVIFLTEEQEREVASVCPPFYRDR